MIYTITLADGRKMENLTMNGNNFVSKTQVDESIFEENLSTVIVSDGENEETYTDVVFIQQMRWVDGTYYLAFREKTPMEKLIEKIGSTSDVEDMREKLTAIETAIERVLTL